MLIFLVILGAIVIILIVVLVMVLMNKPKQQIPPPWMMYPPRRRKKKPPEQEMNVPAPQTQPAAPPVESLPEDIAVLQSEVNDMKQAVVSMSVGQPQAATKIVKDWILEEAPPEPEIAPTAPESEDDGDKKKKKKKK